MHGRAAILYLSKCSQLVTDYVEIPPSVLEKNKHVNLSIDIMYVNRIPFVTTFSRNIKFTTVKAIQNRTKAQLVQSIKNVLPIYTQRGLQVDNALLDGEFVPLCTDLLTLGINTNFATRNKHVPEIERQHRVIKERARACRHSLPFKVLPRLMLVKMVKNCALWLNMFPPKGGIGSMSPRTLITGIKLDYKKHCQLPFGSYVQVHEEPTPTNSPVARTI